MHAESDSFVPTPLSASSGPSTIIAIRLRSQHSTNGTTSVDGCQSFEKVHVYRELKEREPDIQDKTLNVKNWEGRQTTKYTKHTKARKPNELESAS